MNEQEFWAALAPQPAPKPPSYRLYYDENGSPLFYSMEELPGNYIELTAHEYANTPSNIQIVNGKIVVLKTSIVLKLHPSDTGTPCDPTNISIVVPEEVPHVKWKLK